MNRKATSETALLYRSLEEQASQHPVRAITLTGKGPGPLGLLLIGNDIPGPEIASALAGLQFTDQPRAETLALDREKLPDQAWLRRQLALELARARETRLPCALLLIAISGQTEAPGLLAEEAAPLMANCLHLEDLLSVFDKNTLALIIPGASVSKARKRAEEIRNTLRGTAFTKGSSEVLPSLELAMGIAVCHTYAAMTVDQLLALAEAELAQAVKLGNDAICQNAAVRSEDSCQVTVEERAQLWMQPRKAQFGERMAG
jgi:hypothetical protein